MEKILVDKFLKEIKDNLSFIKGHTLQPKWYKIFKVFMILGFLAGYLFLFGQLKTIVFSVIFFSLSLLVRYDCPIYKPVLLFGTRVAGHKRPTVKCRWHCLQQVR